MSSLRGLQEASAHTTSVKTLLPSMRDRSRSCANANREQRATRVGAIAIGQQGRVPMVVPQAIGDGVVVELTPERLARAFA